MTLEIESLFLYCQPMRLVCLLIMSANSPQFENLSQRIDAMEEITEVLRLTKTVNKYYERFLDQVDEDDWLEILSLIHI